MNIYNRRIFGYLFLIMLVLTSSCSTMSRKTNPLSATQVFLQSVNLKTIQPKSYGYTGTNPIILMLSADLNYELVIDEYIGRLWKNGADNSKGSIQSYEVVKKSTLNVRDHTMINENSTNDDFETRIYKYKILSLDKNDQVTLYFALKSRKVEFYVPADFLYSFIVG